MLDLSARSVVQHAGLQTIAFSPAFNTIGQLAEELGGRAVSVAPQH